uniref:Uncharacterized protein n=1 Tax=Cucumis melo TaxID=3656 RepID=A0A9I9EKE4_CUCME
MEHHTAKSTETFMPQSLQHTAKARYTSSCTRPLKVTLVSTPETHLSLPHNMWILRPVLILPASSAGTWCFTTTTSMAILYIPYKTFQHEQTQNTTPTTYWSLIRNFQQTLAVYQAPGARSLPEKWETF